MNSPGRMRENAQVRRRSEQLKIIRTKISIRIVGTGGCVGKLIRDQGARNMLFLSGAGYELTPPQSVFVRSPKVLAELCTL